MSPEAFVKLRSLGLILPNATISGCAPLGEYRKNTATFHASPPTGASPHPTRVPTGSSPQPQPARQRLASSVGRLAGRGCRSMARL
jgi:hypothetical protein